MTESEKIHELARIRALIAKAVHSTEPQQWRQIARSTIRRIDILIERLETDRATTSKKRRKPPTKI